jgi:hypothetical protein
MSDIESNYSDASETGRDDTFRHNAFLEQDTPNSPAIMSKYEKIPEDSESTSKSGPNIFSKLASATKGVLSPPKKPEPIVSYSSGAAFLPTSSHFEYDPDIQQAELDRANMEKTIHDAQQARNQTLAEAEIQAERDFPNPIGDIFEDEEEEIEDEDIAEVPDVVSPDVKKEEFNAKMIRYNEIKKKRTNLYRSITGMKKSAFTLYQSKPTAAWRDLLVRAKEAEKQLIAISEEINGMKLKLQPKEIENVVKYLGLLKEIIGKIEAVTETEKMAIRDITKQVIDNYVKQEEQQRTSSKDDSKDASFRKLVAEVEKLKTKLSETTSATPSDDVADDDISTVVRLKKPNYQGLDKLAIRSFTGYEPDYNRFKISFKANYEGRDIPTNQLAMHLEKKLGGRPLELVQKYLNAGMDPLSYKNMWTILEERFGGEAVEDAYICDEFNKASPLRNDSYKDLERMHDIFQIQLAYYKKHDPESVKQEKSCLTKLAKDKMSKEMNKKYVKYILERSLTTNFETIAQFIKYKFEIAQKLEREFNRSEQKPELRKLNGSSNKHVVEEDSEIEGEVESEEEQLVYYTRNESSGRFNRVKTDSFNKSSFKRPFNPSCGSGQKNSASKYVAKVQSLFEKGTCSACRGKHDLTQCAVFKGLPVPKKYVIMRRDKICYHCLLDVHIITACKTNEKMLCGIGGCERYHHKLLHNDIPTGNHLEDDFGPVEPTQAELDSVNNIDTAYHVATPGAISIQTLVCNITAKGANFKTVALVDSGSNITCIDEDYAKELKLTVLSTRVGRDIHLLDRVVHIPGESYLVEFQLASIDNMCTQVFKGWTYKNLADKTSVVDWSERKKDFPHLKNVKFPKLPSDARVKIVLGINLPHLFVSSKVVMNKSPNAREDDPVAIRIKLGWTCIGKSANHANNKDPKAYFTNILFAPNTQNLKN